VQRADSNVPLRTMNSGRADRLWRLRRLAVPARGFYAPVVGHDAGVIKHAVRDASHVLLGIRIAHSLNGGGDRRGARLRLDGCPARASLLSCPGYRGIFGNARPLPARTASRPPVVSVAACGRMWSVRSEPVRTRDISTSDAPTACDICGRTLLRGERAEVYLSGGARRSVCELCKSRAVNVGWAREGTVPESEEVSPKSPDRRRSFLHRLRPRRDSGSRERATTSPVDDVNESATSPPPTRAQETTEHGLVGGSGFQEPRHVRAVPSSVAQKVASAVELFNSSEHPHTVAGVARSLGMPAVSVRPSDARPSVVTVVVSWELYWYRYEVDLSDDRPSVRVADHGSELDELDEQRQPNADADERGALTLHD
jgi:hypothetical protein